GRPGNSCETASMITASAASSAAVTGDISALLRAPSPPAAAAKTASAARETIVVNSSSSRARSAAAMLCRITLIGPSALAGRAAGVYHTGTLIASCLIRSARRQVPQPQFHRTADHEQTRLPETVACPDP